jgi:hypothetical protein
VLDLRIRFIKERRLVFLSFYVRESLIRDEFIGQMFHRKPLLLRSFKRYIAAMAPLNPPKEPLVVIIGTTGTGKSDVSEMRRLSIQGLVANNILAGSRFGG